jgi:hypothetical protein
VAAFAFAAGALQTFGISVAGDLIQAIDEVVHPELDLTSPLLILALPLVLAALVALGSLSVTVAAVAAAPQVMAFLGLTHYSGGLDRARPAVRVRWVTFPMVVLIVLEALVALSGIAGASS